MQAIREGWDAPQIKQAFGWSGSNSHFRNKVAEVREDAGLQEPGFAGIPQQQSDAIDLTVPIAPDRIGRLARLATMTANAPARSAGTSVTLLASPVVKDLHAVGQEEYAHFTERSTAYLQGRRTNPHDYVKYRVHAQQPVLITNFSDLHLGAEGTDHDKAERDAKLVGGTPGAFAVFGGDGTDNFIKIQSAMIESTSSPAQQYAALGYWMDCAGFIDKPDGTKQSKILAGITGNHEYWTRNTAGLDFLRQMFRERGIAYTPHRLRLSFCVNDYEYRIELRHKYRFKSSLNLSNSLQRMFDFSDWDFDIGLHGHTHDGPGIYPFHRHGKWRWGGLSGSYKVADAYGESEGFNAALPHSPAFILYHDRFKIVPFQDLETGIEFLNAIRGN